MNKKIIINGFLYRLRSIELSDAQDIINIRNEDQHRNKYINPISNELEKQEEWIKNYLDRKNDYYFIIENKITGEKEGLISFYDIDNNIAEWGRWVIKKSSLSSIESVYLLFDYALNKLKLDKLYCRSIKDNVNVIMFHDNIGEIRYKEYENFFHINNTYYDAIEHQIDLNTFNNIKNNLIDKSLQLLLREIKKNLKLFKFHHIGVACKDISEEFASFSLLGYKKEGNAFIDEKQGIKGQFLISNKAPRLELLENLNNSNTLDYWNKQGIKMYHFGYIVDDIFKTKELFLKIGAKLISDIKYSTYFKDNICFLVLKNKFILEIIQNKE